MRSFIFVKRGSLHTDVRVLQGFLRFENLKRSRFMATSLIIAAFFLSKMSDQHAKKFEKVGGGWKKGRRTRLKFVE